MHVVAPSAVTGLVCRNFYVIENGLRNAVGHHLNNSLGLKSALERRRIQTKFLIHRDAKPEICALVRGVPCIRYTPYDVISEDVLCGYIESSLMQGSVVGQSLCAVLGGDVNSDDVVFIPTASQHEILACAWLAERMDKRLHPRFVFNLTRENFLGKTVDELSPEASMYRFAANRLFRAVAADRVLFTSNGLGMAAKLSHVTGRDVKVAPFPKVYPDELSNSLLPDGREGLRVGVFGHAKSYKGFELLPDLIKRNQNFRWMVQCPINRDIVGSEIKADVVVEKFASGLEPAAYYEMFQRADIVLLPYDGGARRLQSSGVFAEAVAAGKIVVGPNSGWFKEQKEAQCFSGAMFDIQTVDAISEALQSVREDYFSLHSLAKRLAIKWRACHSVDAYLDYIFMCLSFKKLPSNNLRQS